MNEKCVQADKVEVHSRSGMKWWNGKEECAKSADQWGVAIAMTD